MVHRKINGYKVEARLPRILVISALPIDKSASTRAFYTYFDKIPKENIAQIYTNVSSPKDFSLCQRYYRINDSELVKRRFNKKMIVGKPITSVSNDKVKPTKSLKKLISLGKKDYAITDLLRSTLWKEKYYLNEQLKSWIKEFNPDILFFHNSNALFMENMCLAVNAFINKPIIMEISDDYYFSKKKTVSPLYFIRKRKYKNTFEKIIKISKQQIYVSDKMRDKYNSYFFKEGKTIHISSATRETLNKNKNKKVFKIGYFGNLGLGRKKSIHQIGHALSTISKNTCIDVYSPKLGNSKANNKNNDFIKYHGFLPYSEVEKQLPQYDLLLFVESFKKKIIEDTRYSLSTKISDYLSSGVPVYAYGPKESGSIQFLKENSCAFVCLSKKEVKNSLNIAINDKNAREKIVENANKIVRSKFDFEYNSNLSLEILKEAF